MYLILKLIITLSLYSFSSDGTLTTHFETTPLMSTYLVAFIISDFIQKNVTTNNFTYRIYARPSAIDKIDLALNDSAKLLNNLSAYFEIPFSLPKMDQIAIPDFHSGAMENWGLITYR